MSLWHETHKEYLRQKAREWRLANPERARRNVAEWRNKNRDRQRQLQRDWYRRKYVANTYGVPVGWYEAQVEKQNGLCAICGNPPQGRRKRLVVDHDHVTGKVRELLCDSCNTALHRVETVPDWEHKARTYLNRHVQ